MKLFNTDKDSRDAQLERLIRQLNRLQRQTARTARKTTDEFYLAPVQRHVILLLRDKSIQTMGDLAQELSVSKSAATQILDTLVERGFVERKQDESDRRIVRFNLTKKSQKLQKEFYKRTMSVFSELFKPLSDQELAEYVQLTDKIIENQQKMNRGERGVK